MLHKTTHDSPLSMAKIAMRLQQNTYQLLWTGGTDLRELQSSSAFSLKEGD